MQTIMTLEACSRCGQPIPPGEPAMQTASVDIVGGRAVFLAGEGIPPAGTVLRRVQSRRSRPQEGAHRRIDGSHRAASHEVRPLPHRDGGASLRTEHIP